MLTAHTPPPLPTSNSTARPHTHRALAHGGARRALLLLALLASCGGSDPEPQESDQRQSFAPQKGREFVRSDGVSADPFTRIPVDAPIPEQARSAMREFLEAMVMPPLDETSDIHDAWIHRTRALVEKLKQGNEDVGNAALHAFVGDASESYHTRRALLAIGAHASPDAAATLLHKLTFTYGYRIEDRAEACLLLPVADPEGYLAAAEEFLARRGRKSMTMPDDEFLMAAWVNACARTGRSPVEMCADVATNLWMEPMARYIAATTLSEHTGNPLARSALETCLVESTGDGMLRIKAAQAIAAGYPRETACGLFEDVLQHEISSQMREFLQNMIAHYCNDE